MSCYAPCVQGGPCITFKYSRDSLVARDLSSTTRNYWIRSAFIFELDSHCMQPYWLQARETEREQVEKQTSLLPARVATIIIYKSSLKYPKNKIFVNLFVILIRRNLTDWQDSPDKNVSKHGPDRSNFMVVKPGSHVSNNSVE